MRNFCIQVLLYLIVLYAVPFLLIAHFLDSFIRVAIDVRHLHRFIQEKMPRA